MPLDDSTEIFCWCTDCGVRLSKAEAESKGSRSCPKCGSLCSPCDPIRDVTVEVNWHELHILCEWAERWALYTGSVDAGAGRLTAEVSGMPVTVAAIAARLRHQWPALGPLTLTSEVAELSEKLAESGIEVVEVISDIPSSPKLTSIGPGAVGFAKKRADT